MSVSELLRMGDQAVFANSQKAIAKGVLIALPERSLFARRCLCYPRPTCQPKSVPVTNIIKSIDDYRAAVSTHESALAHLTFHFDLT
jgi:hypothetical protein